MNNRGAARKKSPYGTWKCDICGEIFDTRKLLRIHNKTSGHGAIKVSRFNKDIKGKSFEERFGVERAKEIKSKLSKSMKKCYETYSSSEANKRRIEKIKKTAAERHSIGGLRKGSGRGKKGWYKGYYCDSTWELAYVIYNLEHGIPFRRNTKSFEYVFNGENKKYYPDFLLETGEYVEVKGYYTKQFAAKIEQFPKEHTLIIYDKNGIKPFLEYVINKYGKDYYTLYEDCKIKPKEPKPKIIRPIERKHKKPIRRKVEKFCIMCGNQLYSDQQQFCSRDCHNKHQALHKPSYEELLELRRLGKSNIIIANQFNVTETTIRKWFKKYENLLMGTN